MKFKAHLFPFVMKKFLFFALGLIAASIIITAHVILLVESFYENAEITTLLDAYWWAVTTVTTVGYGDILPVSDEGKIIGMILAFVGIFTLGTAFYFIREVIFSAGKEKITFEKEAKNLIKNKVDRLEKLDRKDLEDLIDMLKHLHAKQNKNSESKQN